MRHFRRLDDATLDAIVAWLNEHDGRTWAMAQERWGISQHVFQREIAALVEAGRIKDRRVSTRVERGRAVREAARQALAAQPDLSQTELGARLSISRAYAQRLRWEIRREAGQHDTTEQAAVPNDAVQRIYGLAWLRERWEGRQ
jgi:DNA-binding transcriptional regulator LsrR (DeoR family)